MISLNRRCSCFALYSVFKPRSNSSQLHLNNLQQCNHTDPTQQAKNARTCIGGCRLSMIRSLTRRPFHITTAKQVKMNMPDNLATCSVTVRNQAKTVLGKIELMSQLTGNLIYVADQFIVSGRQVENGANMLTRYDQQMMRGLGLNILKSDNRFIRIDYLVDFK